MSQDLGPTRPRRRTQPAEQEQDRTDRTADTQPRGLALPAKPAGPSRTSGSRRTQSYVNRAATVGLVLAALVVGRIITTSFQAGDSISAPFLKAGKVGTAVSLRYADVTATRVEGTPCVSTDVVSVGMRTPGVFVVVPLVITVKGEPADVRYAALKDTQGRTFLAGTGTRSSFLPGTGQPGVPHYASVVVEVPRDAVAGAHLRIALDSLDQRRDDMADIDLGLTSADVDKWARSNTSISVPGASDLPPAAARPGVSCAR